MKRLYFSLSLLFTTPSCAYPLYRTLETPFLQMNTECYIYSDKQFICSDIDIAIDNDPYSIDDVKFICKKLKVNNFTTTDLVDFINSKFDKFGLQCNLFPINNFNLTEVRKHCSEIYGKTCSSIDSSNNVLLIWRQSN